MSPSSKMVHGRSVWSSRSHKLPHSTTSPPFIALKTWSHSRRELPFTGTVMSFKRIMGPHRLPAWGCWRWTGNRKFIWSGLIPPPWDMPWGVVLHTGIRVPPTYGNKYMYNVMATNQIWHFVIAFYCELLLSISCILFLLVQHGPRRFVDSHGHT